MSADESTYIPRVYTLTKITGRRRNDDREVVIKGLEMNRRVFNTGLIGLVPSILVAALFATLIGVYAVLVWAACMALWFALVHRQASAGLRVPIYRSLLDRSRKRSQVGAFLQCGIEVTPATFDDVQVLLSTVPLERTSTDQDDLDEAMGLPARAATVPAHVPVATRPPVSSTPNRATDADTFLEGLL